MSGAGVPTRRAMAFVGAFALLTAGQAEGQVAGAYQRQSYSFDDAAAAGMERFTLTTIPWSVTLDPLSRVSLAASGAWARGTASGAVGTASLSGLTDTDLGIRVAVDDWLVVGADVTLSTGKSSLTTAESIVAGFVAADLLPVPISTWGSGRSTGGTIAVARQVGPWGIGVAGGYRVSNGFDAAAGDVLRYDPGDHLQARLAIDRDVAGSSTLSFLVGYQHFSEDQLQGANLFRSGSRLQTVASMTFPVGLRSSAVVYAGVSHRARGTLLLDASSLAGATDSPSQQLFTAGSDLRLPLGRSLAFLPSGELRVFRAADGASQGWVGTLDGTLDLRLAGNSSSRRLVMSAGGGLILGNVVVEDGADAGFTGWRADLALRVERGR